MGFEKFEGTGSGRGGGETEPMISVRKSGSIGINSAALEEYFEGYDAAVMYYDEDENRLGIERVEDKDSDEHAYTVSKSDSGGSITPSAFLNRNQLTPEITKQYRPETHKVNQNLELVALDLDEPIGTYGSPEEGE